ncbi:MAG: 4-hydroxy-2-oxoheptanedioate aldolase [Pseudomonadota bacterium]
MQTPVNQFKKALKTGEVQYGLWLAMADAYSTEIAAGAGFDWLLIDAEHAPNDVRTTLSQLQAIAAYTSSPIVRPVEGNAALIKQLLDIGAQSLLIPMIESAAQAEEMVKAIHYPPAGVRGVGAAIARASNWNRDGDYHHHAHEHICLLLQIESLAGLRNLDEILAVDGVDGIFIGPADLAASLGFIGQSGHPQVQAAISEAMEKIRASGKAIGILTTEPELAKRYTENGATFIGVGVDALVLTQSLSNLISAYKP